MAKKKSTKRKSWQKLTTKQKISRVEANIKKIVPKKAVARKILKPSQITVRIKESKPAGYVSRYFKEEEIKGDEMNFFIK